MKIKKGMMFQTENGNGIVCRKDFTIDLTGIKNLEVECPVRWVGYRL